MAWPPFVLSSDELTVPGSTVRLLSTACFFLSKRFGFTATLSPTQRGINLDRHSKRYGTLVLGASFPDAIANAQIASPPFSLVAPSY